MTYRELYLQAKRTLTAGGVDAPGFDALALTEHFLGLSRAGLALQGEKSPFPKQEEAFLQAVRERAARRPLQYILGSWEFMGLTLAVGEGVLCPREDTAVLVEALAKRLKNHRSPKGLDLCAGTGAVALGICSLLPAAEVSCLELSSLAFPYLEQNLKTHSQYSVRALQGNVLSKETTKAFAPGSLDFIASNPPYIKTDDLPGLEPEVQKEPVLALDGGGDGLQFYRVILQLWAPLLKPGGILAVEIGEDQGQAVFSLFSSYGLKEIALRQDWAGHDRAVLGSL